LIQLRVNENAYIKNPPTLHPGPTSAHLNRMGKLTTHVLDTASGTPAQGVRIRLFHDEILLADTLTNADGRCDAPLLADPPPGEYRLIFSIGDYFRAQGISSPFLNDIPVHFSIEAGRNFHVPLVCSPYSYSTYRGS
jgi:5-hydroxyisourate hydrolase